MARRGRKVDPEKEFKNFMNSMDEFLHKGQYSSLTILMEGILDGKGVTYKGEFSKYIQRGDGFLI